MSLIDKVLEKRGLKPEDLSPEEKQTIKDWQAILSGGTVTIEKLKEWCGYNLDAIEGQFKNLDNSPEKVQKLVLLHNVYKSLIGLMSNPQAERDALEKHLTAML